MSRWDTRAILVRLGALAAGLLIAWLVIEAWAYSGAILGNYFAMENKPAREATTPGEVSVKVLPPPRDEQERRDAAKPPPPK